MGFIINKKKQNSVINKTFDTAFKHIHLGTPKDIDVIDDMFIMWKKTRELTPSQYLYLSDITKRLKTASRSRKNRGE